jgi:hypothetical protein
MCTTIDLRKYLRIGLLLALTTIFLIGGWAEAAQADRGRGGRDGRDDRGSSVREFRDSRYRHDRSYPVRGRVFRELPRDRRVIVHGGSRFFFHGGIWYRPHGTQFIVALPPVGVFVPILPPYYSTIWVRGVPYYYANEVYYAHRGSGYVVVEPPREEVSEAPPPAEQMFVYPRLGQGEKQQADDRYACHSWAVGETGFDPTQPQGGGSADQKRADYQRAMGACLDGRGYTVK